MQPARHKSVTDKCCSNISAYQMNSLADDDVFTEDASRESNSSMHVSNQGFDILRREGRELGKSSARPIPVDAQGIYPPSACVFVAKYIQPIAPNPGPYAHG